MRRKRSSSYPGPVTSTGPQQNTTKSGISMFDSDLRVEPFSPHAFQTRVELPDGVPTIYLTRETYDDSKALAALLETEVGWLCAVRKVAGGYLLETVYMVDQTASGTQCNLSTDGQAELAYDLYEKYGSWDMIRCWMHSHVRMGTSPSTQDDSQLRELVDAGCDFFIRGIVNKLGRIEFTIRYKNGLTINDVPWKLWEVVEKDRIEKWRQEVEQKVTRQYYTPYVPPVVNYSKSSWENFYDPKNFDSKGGNDDESD